MLRVPNALVTPRFFSMILRNEKAFFHFVQNNPMIKSLQDLPIFPFQPEGKKKNGRLGRHKSTKSRRLIARRFVVLRPQIPRDPSVRRHVLCVVRLRPGQAGDPGLHRPHLSHLRPLQLPMLPEAESKVRKWTEILVRRSMRLFP